MKQFGLLSVFACLLLFSCKDPEQPKALPFFGNYDILTYENNGIKEVDTVYPVIPTFHFLNQDSVQVTNKSFKGKVWIANFFFTSCPSICPPMMAQMKRLHKKTEDIHGELQFLSFSIDPNHDQPSVLRAYRKNNGISAKNWTMLTGDEQKTHYLGVHHFMVHAKKDPMAAGGFAHSDGMVLVDREGYVRGIYLGTQTDQVDQLNKDLRKLLNIEYGIDCKKE